MPIFKATSLEAEIGDITIGNVDVNLPTGFISEQLVVGTSAVSFGARVLAAGSSVSAPASNTVAIFVGPSGVTTATGYELQPGESVPVVVDNSSKIFAISGSAAQRADLLAG